MEYWVRLEMRLFNFEGKGEVIMDDFVRNIFCMCFDRIIVGEVCGLEVRMMFMVMNMGYNGVFYDFFVI